MRKLSIVEPAGVEHVKKGKMLSLRGFARRHLNFYRIHFLCFSILPLVAGAIFYASNGPAPENQIAFIDCIYMTYSAMTACGLVTVPFAVVTVWQQVILFLLTAFGSLSFVSIIVILVRRHYFRKRFQHLLVHSPTVRERMQALSHKPANDSREVERGGSPVSTIKRKVRFPGTSPKFQHNGFGSDSRNRALSTTSRMSRRSNMSHAPSRSAPREDLGGFKSPVDIALGYVANKVDDLLRRREDNMPRTSTIVSTRSVRQGNDPERPHRLERVVSQLPVGRNSRFLHLSSEQAEELGGVEYRALSLLLKIVIGYWAVLQLIGVVTVAPWMSHSATYRPIFNPPDARPINPTWFSFFLAISAFGNNGMSIVDNSMVDFKEAHWLLIITGILVLAGNTALPCFLRLTIWTGSKLVPRDSRVKESLEFLLEHPRRTYIYLFPARQTWLLVFLLFLFNGIDWLFFWLLDIGNEAVEALTPGVRCINGLFQALALRTGGFAVINLATVAPALQFTFAIMMYISAYPIAISVRSSNVYEDQAVGILETDEEEEEVEENAQPPSAFILLHIRRQLSFDIGFLTFGVFLLCVFERHRIGSPNWPEVTIFSLIFEILSAYGCVGLSLGSSRTAASLSGVLRTLSKLVLIATMVRGRHRGLPVAIDRSILLPSELEDPGTEESDVE
ncbi:hypothetical protein JCM3766R1_004534 [Sporobolomyces carnicolor]